MGVEQLPERGECRGAGWRGLGDAHADGEVLDCDDSDVWIGCNEVAEEGDVGPETDLLLSVSQWLRSLDVRPLTPIPCKNRMGSFVVERCGLSQ